MGSSNESPERHPFVAEGREEYVQLLQDEFSLLLDPEQGGPRLVRLEAPSGQGKTRIVQEFYARIARDQTYWPASHVDEEAPAVSSSRKRIFHDGKWHTGPGAVPWMWMGVDCDRTATRALSADLDGPRRQLEDHLPSIFDESSEPWSIRKLLRLGTDHAADVTAAAVLAMAGIAAAPLLPLALLGKSAVAQGFAGVKRRKLEALEESERAVQRDGSVAEELTAAIAQVDMRRRVRLPFVLVIEDSHLATQELCWALSLILNPENKRKIPVLIIALGWPELIDDGLNWVRGEPGTERPYCNLLAWLQGLCIDHPKHAPQPRLPEFSEEGLHTLVLAQYPRTSLSVCEGLASRAGHNPLALELLLELRDVSRNAVHGELTLDAEELQALPSTLSEIYAQLWAELGEDVQDVLAIAALQGREPVTTLTEHLAAELLPDRPHGPPVSQSLDLAIHPYAWVRRIAEQLLWFFERERYELACSHDAYIGRRRIKAHQLIAHYVIGVRDDRDSAEQGLARERLLQLHIDLVQANDERGNQADTAAVLSLIEGAKSAMALARMQMGRGDFAASEMQLREASIDPETPAFVRNTSLQELARVLLLRGDFQGAEHALRAVIDDPTTLDHQRLLSQQLLSQLLDR